MSKPVVLVCETLSDATYAVLGDGVEVRFCNGGDPAELLAAVPEADALLIRSATKVTAEVIANINTNEAFGVAWGVDGQVLSYDETTAAIDAGRGWFDRQGRWVNMARMNKLATK